MKKIGWQKYEDMLEQQLHSPLLQALYEAMTPDMNGEEEFDEEDIYPQDQMIQIDPKMMENVTLTSNFDCWMGHTNFNITPEIKEELNKVDGVEILKICSRYRFFVGVGKMFDFSNVRRSIENTLSVKDGDKN
jgi:hypothetical protein